VFEDEKSELVMEECRGACDLKQSASWREFAKSELEAATNHDSGE
jgi:hypothetical protein